MQELHTISFSMAAGYLMAEEQRLQSRLVHRKINPGPTGVHGIIHLLLPWKFSTPFPARNKFQKVVRESYWTIAVNAAHPHNL